MIRAGDAYNRLEEDGEEEGSGVLNKTSWKHPTHDKYSVDESRENKSSSATATGVSDDIIEFEEKEAEAGEEDGGN